MTIVQGAFFPVPPLRGGAVEKVWFALGQALAARGHCVTHISREYEGLTRSEEICGVAHVRVRGGDAPRNVMLYKWRDLIYSLRARRALPPGDVVVTNTFWLPILGVPRRAGKMYVHVARYPKGQMKWYGKAARLQAISQAVAQAIMNEAPQFEKRVSVVPYPALDVTKDAPEISESQTVLYVGRLHEEKGLNILCEAFRKMHPKQRALRLRLVGPWRIEEGGGGEGYLDKIQSAFGHDARGATQIEGPVFDSVALSKVYREAAILVYPSISERGEAFGLSILEAMSHGCFPVVSALACFGDIIEDGKTGLVFDHRTGNAADELAAKLEFLLADDHGLKLKRRQAWERAGEFRLERVAEAYEADMRAVLEQ